MDLHDDFDGPIDLTIKKSDIWDVPGNTDTDKDTTDTDVNPDINKLQELVKNVPHEPGILQQTDDVIHNQPIEVNDVTRRETRPHDVMSDCDVTVIPHTPVPGDGRVKNRAVFTLPEGLLLITSTKSNKARRVLSAVPLAKATRFGPYEGEIKPNHEVSKYCWDVFDGDRFQHCVDGQDDSKATWMKYVKFAGENESANMFAFQQESSIYYQVMADIRPDTELLLHTWKSAEPRKEDDATPDGSEQASMVNGYSERRDHSADVFLPLTVDTTSPRLDFNDNVEICRNKDRSAGMNPFPCKLCDKSFQDHHKLKRHMHVHSGYKPFGCTVCNRPFNRIDSVKTHMKSVHGFVGEPNRLERDTQQQIKDIGLMMVPIETKACPVCGKHTLHLNRHMKVHTRPYKCEVCEKAFARLSDYRNHLTKRHDQADEFVLDSMISRAREVADLSQNAIPSAGSHNTEGLASRGGSVASSTVSSAPSEHGDEISSIFSDTLAQAVGGGSASMTHSPAGSVHDDSMYTSEAGRVDTMEVELDQNQQNPENQQKSTDDGSIPTMDHTPSQTDESSSVTPSADMKYPLNCKICDKSFSSLQSVRRHEAVHSGNKPYQCNICEKHFSRSDHLKTHKDSVHKDKTDNDDAETVAYDEQGDHADCGMDVGSIFSAFVGGDFNVDNMDTEDNIADNRSREQEEDTTATSVPQFESVYDCGTYYTSGKDGDQVEVVKDKNPSRHPNTAHEGGDLNDNQGDDFPLNITDILYKDFDTELQSMSARSIPDITRNEPKKKKVPTATLR